ncbi:nuclear transport factor 2 family protein [Gordonia sputi]
MSPREIGERFLTAWSRNDMTEATQYLAPDIAFHSPQADLTGIDTVSQALAEFAAVVEAITIISLIGDADRVMAMYDMHTTAFGTIRAAETYVITGGLIHTDYLVFDTAALTPDQ